MEALIAIVQSIRLSTEFIVESIASTFSSQSSNQPDEDDQSFKKSADVRSYKESVENGQSLKESAKANQSLKESNKADRSLKESDEEVKSSQSLVVMESITSALAKQSLNESNAKSQSSNHATSLSNKRFLEDLSPPLFFLVCSFLTLDEKCANMLMLSKSTKQTIKQSINHFHTGLVSVEYHNPADGQVPEKIINMLHLKRNGRINYLQYASRVDANIQCPIDGNRRKNLVLSLKKGIATGVLKELALYEYNPSNDPTVISDIVKALSHPNVAIEKLFIQLDDALPLHDLSYWAGLKKCNKLKYLRVAFTDTLAPPHTVERLAPMLMSHSDLIESMPDSVETVVIETSLPLSHMILIWNQALLDKKVLPNLRAITIRDRQTKGVCGTANFLDALVSTVCRATGKIRPIDSWGADMEQLSKSRKFDLTDLGIAGISPDILKEMSKPETNLWPNLKRVSPLIVNRTDGCDILPLMMLSAKRRVHKFQYATDNPNPRLSLNRQCVQTLARMSELEFLRIKNTSQAPTFMERDFTGMIPVNSWSKLQSLDICVPDLSESQLSNMLAACPNVTYVCLMLTQRALSHSMILAMILHYCPFVRRIIFATRGAAETIKDAQTSFKHYPTPAGGPKHLVSLHSPSLHEVDRVLHYLIKQVSGSPVLEYVALDAAATSPLGLCMTRALPHLRSLHQLGEDDLDGNVRSTIRKFRSPALEQCFEFRIPAASDNPLENMRYMINNSIMYFAESFDDVIAEKYPSGSCYPAFKKKVPGTTQSGRERFYSLLYDLLPASEQAQLTAFDKGDYGVATPARKKR